MEIAPSVATESALVTHLISLFLGAAASYLVWWWLNHKWVPKLEFALEICRYSVDQDKKLYVCAFSNIGKREIVDVEVVTQVGVNNFNGSSGWQYFSLKTNSTRLPIIEPRRRALVRVFDERDSPTFIDPPSHGLAAKIEDCETLEDLFHICPEVSLQLNVFGYDGFSGARRRFASSKYTKSEIRSGRFKGLLIVEDQTGLVLEEQ
ncbi:MAG: hypothetical protein ABJL72_04910 [Roseobacter sp.]